MSISAERINAALRRYRAAEDAGDTTAAAQAREELRQRVRDAYEPCDVEAGMCGVAGWVAPW